MPLDSIDHVSPSLHTACSSTHVGTASNSVAGTAVRRRCQHRTPEMLEGLWAM